MVVRATPDTKIKYHVPHPGSPVEELKVAFCLTGASRSLPTVPVLHGDTVMPADVTGSQASARRFSFCSVRFGKEAWVWKVFCSSSSSGAPCVAW